MMSRVDAHHHIWDLSVREQSWMVGPELDPIRRNFSIDDLAPQAAAADITATVLVQTVGLVDETVEFLEVAASNDLVAGVVGWVDLTAPDVADALAGLLARPDGSYLKGIRHQVHDEPDVDWLLRPDVQRGLAAVADAGLVYDLLTKTPHLPAAIETARALPGLTFVVDHISKPVIGDPLEPWATRPPLAGRPPQRHLQTLRHGHRGLLDRLETVRPPAVRRRRPGRLRPRPGDVRLRLARLPPGRHRTPTSSKRPKPSPPT